MSIADLLQKLPPPDPYQQDRQRQDPISSLGGMVMQMLQNQQSQQENRRNTAIQTLGSLVGSQRAAQEAAAERANALKIAETESMGRVEATRIAHPPRGEKDKYQAALEGQQLVSNVMQAAQTGDLGTAKQMADQVRGLGIPVPSNLQLIQIAADVKGKDMDPEEKAQIIRDLTEQMVRNDPSDKDLQAHFDRLNQGSADVNPDDSTLMQKMGFSLEEGFVPWARDALWGWHDFYDDKTIRYMDDDGRIYSQEDADRMGYQRDGKPLIQAPKDARTWWEWAMSNMETALAVDAAIPFAGAAVGAGVKGATLGAKYAARGAARGAAGAVGGARQAVRRAREALGSDLIDLIPGTARAKAKKASRQATSDATDYLSMIRDPDDLALRAIPEQSDLFKRLNLLRSEMKDPKKAKSMWLNIEKALEVDPTGAAKFPELKDGLQKLGSKVPNFDDSSPETVWKSLFPDAEIPTWEIGPTPKPQVPYKRPPAPPTPKPAPRANTGSGAKQKLLKEQDSIDEMLTPAESWIPPADKYSKDVPLAPRTGATGTRKRKPGPGEEITPEDIEPNVQVAEYADEVPPVTKPPRFTPQKPNSGTAAQKKLAEEQAARQPGKQAKPKDIPPPEEGPGVAQLSDVQPKGPKPPASKSSGQDFDMEHWKRKAKEREPDSSYFVGNSEDPNLHYVHQGQVLRPKKFYGSAAELAQEPFERLSNYFVGNPPIDLSINMDDVVQILTRGKIRKHQDLIYDPAVQAAKKAGTIKPGAGNVSSSAKNPATRFEAQAPQAKQSNQAVNSGKAKLEAAQASNKPPAPEPNRSFKMSEFTQGRRMNEAMNSINGLKKTDDGMDKLAGMFKDPEAAKEWLRGASPREILEQLTGGTIPQRANVNRGANRGKGRPGRARR